MNHRVIGGRHIIAGVSGGVRVDAGQSLAVASAEASAASTLASMRADAPEAPRGPAARDGELVWWWD
jgi:hypothetical protein